MPVIDFPKNAYNGVFDKELKRGSVIKTLFRCHDGKDRFKHFIILNNDLSQDPIVFILTTSQLEFYDKHPHFNKDIVRVDSAAVNFFPKETIISCRDVYKIQKDILKKNFQSNSLKFVGELPETILQEIDTIIKRSFLVSNNDKKLVLGEDNSDHKVKTE